MLSSANSNDDITYQSTLLQMRVVGLLNKYLDGNEHPLTNFRLC